MKKSFVKLLSISALALSLVNASGLSGVSVLAHGQEESGHNHDHNHEHDHHNHNHDENEESSGLTIINKEDVEDRALSDWEGEWQSVYPYLQDGTLDSVMAQKAKEDSTMTAEEYKDYYETGYQTDVDHIDIDGESGTITFIKEESEATGEYEYERSEHLVYESGSMGVRYLFTKVGGDEEAPTTIQFSDHEYTPTKVGHYHIYFSNDSHDELLKEMDHWPTYYPASMIAEDIEHEMLHH